MKLLKLFWDEFIYGGHLLSLGAVSIVFTTAILLNISITWDALFVTYLGAHTVYLYNRLREIRYDALTNPRRTKHILRYLKYIPYIIFFLVSLAAAIVLFFGKFLVAVFGVCLVLSGFIYTDIIKPRVKGVIALKNLYIAFFWACLTIFLALYYSYPLNVSLIAIFLFVYLRWIVNTVFFDIKDVRMDKKRKIPTLPATLGIKNTLRVLVLITLSSAALLAVSVYLKILPLISLFLLFTVPYTFYYMLALQKKSITNEILYYVIVDSEFLFWALAILLGCTKF
ncbi:UbiA family prenyltransferase [Candidatus Bathyarchaeota archaeon]|nr:UbiA family prenyltransferase [Candidatus Bathyarchaeota archaeon]